MLNIKSVAIVILTSILTLPVLAEVRTAGAPQPILSHAYWAGVWANAAQADEAFLRGAWKMIAHAKSAICNEMMSKDAYNKDGIKNPDGSQSFTLTFGDFASPEPGLNGTIFAVTISGIGSKRTVQGPYQASPVEPQFSVWAYKDTSLSKTMYFEHSCRKTGDAQMICTFPPKNADSSSGKKCAALADGLVAVYERM